MEAEGFEPPRNMAMLPPNSQFGAFGHSATPPAEDHTTPQRYRKYGYVGARRNSRVGYDDLT